MDGWIDVYIYIMINIPIVHHEIQFFRGQNESSLTVARHPPRAEAPKVDFGQPRIPSGSFTSGC